MSVQDNLPRYLEIRRDLQERIASGAWHPGHKVPAEYELQEQYGCSRMTVSKALSALASAGLIVRRRRAGSFVAFPKSQESVLKISDIKAEILARGETYRFDVLLREERPATEEDVRRLGVGIATPVLALSVLHLAGDVPYVMEDRLINLAVVPAASAEPFKAAPPGTWLLGFVAWSHAEQTITAELATALLAKRLQIAKNAPCLTLERHTWQAGETVTAVRLSYPGERHRLVSLFNPGGRVGAP